MEISNTISGNIPLTSNRKRPFSQDETKTDQVEHVFGRVFSHSSSPSETQIHIHYWGEKITAICIHERPPDRKESFKENTDPQNNQCMYIISVKLIQKQLKHAYEGKALDPLDIAYMQNIPSEKRNKSPKKICKNKQPNERESGFLVQKIFKRYEKAVLDKSNVFIGDKNESEGSLKLVQCLKTENIFLKKRIAQGKGVFTKIIVPLNDLKNQKEIAFLRQNPQLAQMLLSINKKHFLIIRNWEQLCFLYENTLIDYNIRVVIQKKQEQWKKGQQILDAIYPNLGTSIRQKFVAEIDNLVVLHRSRQQIKNKQHCFNKSLLSNSKSNVVWGQGNWKARKPLPLTESLITNTSNDNITVWANEFFHTFKELDFATTVRVYTKAGHKKLITGVYVSGRPKDWEESFLKKRDPNTEQVRHIISVNLIKKSMNRAYQSLDITNFDRADKEVLLKKIFQEYAHAVVDQNNLFIGNKEENEGALELIQILQKQQVNLEKIVQKTRHFERFTVDLCTDKNKKVIAFFKQIPPLQEMLLYDFNDRPYLLIKNWENLCFLYECTLIDYNEKVLSDEKERQWQEGQRLIDDLYKNLDTSIRKNWNESWQKKRDWEQKRQGSLSSFLVLNSSKN